MSRSMNTYLKQPNEYISHKHIIRYILIDYLTRGIHLTALFFNPLGHLGWYANTGHALSVELTATLVPIWHKAFETALPIFAFFKVLTSCCFLVHYNKQLLLFQHFCPECQNIVLNAERAIFNDMALWLIYIIKV